MSGLAPDDLARIRARFDSPAKRRFNLLQTVEIAEAWEAGQNCHAIAPRFRCGVQSVAMLIGSLKQAGVHLRLAAGARAPTLAAAPVVDADAFDEPAYRQTPSAPRRFSWQEPA